MGCRSGPADLRWPWPRLLASLREAVGRLFWGGLRWNVGGSESRSMRSIQSLGPMMLAAAARNASSRLNPVRPRTRMDRLVILSRLTMSSALPVPFDTAHLCLMGGYVTAQMGVGARHEVLPRIRSTSTGIAVDGSGPFLLGARSLSAK